MVGKSKMDRRGSGPLWFLLLGIVIYALFSLMIALGTVDKCDDFGREWQIFPPEWKCVADPNFG